MNHILPEHLGDSIFKKDYTIPYAYIAGSMYKGIASKELVIRLGKAGLRGYFGTGGLRLELVEAAINEIQSALGRNNQYGMNLLCNLIKPELEEQTVELFLKYQIKYIEASAYTQITPAIVYMRLKGLTRNQEGNIEIPSYIIAKISRPETAELFMSPAPHIIVKQLVERKLLTLEEAKLGEEIPLSHDVCVESDSGGHTDQRVALTMLPTIIRLKNEMMNKFQYKKMIRVGAAGGIGTPEAAAACFIIGADFILTGSINQCSVEAGISDVAKDILQTMDVQDTTYAPAGDMFEIGARVQVARKGILFPVRANKLYDLYRQYDSLDAINEKTQKQIQELYFKRSFAEVWEETKAYYMKEKPEIVQEAEKNPKKKMTLILRWYFIYTMRLALKGDPQTADYQIHCGSALGAFNQWVKGTPLENWRNRHVDEIAKKLMHETAALLSQRFSSMK